MEYLILFAVLLSAYIIYERRSDNLENDYRNKTLELQQKLSNLEKEYKQKLSDLEKEYKQKDIKLRENVKKIAQDNTQNAPWLAERYADYFETIDNQIEEYLIYKKIQLLKQVKLYPL